MRKRAQLSSKRAHIPKLFVISRNSSKNTHYWTPQKNEFASNKFSNRARNFSQKYGPTKKWRLPKYAPSNINHSIPGPFFHI